MTSDDRKITANFPHKTLTPIVGMPTYETIKDLHDKLSENACMVHSNLGNGKLGYLGITVKPEVYNTLSNVAFVTPPNPGPTPVFPNDATGPQIANIRVIFAEEAQKFSTYMAVSSAIAALIVSAIDPVYLAALRQPYI